MLLIRIDFRENRDNQFDSAVGGPRRLFPGLLSGTLGASCVPGPDLAALAGNPRPPGQARMEQDAAAEVQRGAAQASSRVLAPGCGRRRVTGLSPTCRRSGCSGVPLRGPRGARGSCSTRSFRGTARQAGPRPSTCTWNGGGRLSESFSSVTEDGTFL